MTSSPRSSKSKLSVRLCHICNKPEQIPIKPLRQCAGCRARFHPSCVNSGGTLVSIKIEQDRDWHCHRCSKKQSYLENSSQTNPTPAKTYNSRCCKCHLFFIGRYLAKDPLCSSCKRTKQYVDSQDEASEPPEALVREWNKPESFSGNIFQTESQREIPDSPCIVREDSNLPGSPSPPGHSATPSRKRKRSSSGSEPGIQLSNVSSSELNRLANNEAIGFGKPDLLPPTRDVDQKSVRLDHDTEDVKTEKQEIKIESSPASGDLDMFDSDAIISNATYFSTALIGHHGGLDLVDEHDDMEHEDDLPNDYDVMTKASQESDPQIVLVSSRDDSDSEDFNNAYYSDKHRQRRRRTLIPDSSSETSASSPSRDSSVDNPQPPQPPTRFDRTELRRQRLIANFDDAGLDKILAAPPETLTGISFARRRWSHLESNKPYLRDKDWLAWKRAQIEARGGKKGQYGKILTKEILLYRKERGWHPNQTKDLDPNYNKDKVHDFGDIEPAVINGQLVMADASKNSYGRKSRNSVRKCWKIDD